MKNKILCQKLFIKKSLENLVLSNITSTFFRENIFKTNEIVNKYNVTPGDQYMKII